MPTICLEGPVIHHNGCAVVSMVKSNCAYGGPIGKAPHGRMLMLWPLNGQ